MQHMVWQQISEDQWATKEGIWRDTLHPHLTKHSVNMHRAPECFFHPFGYILFTDGVYLLYVSTSSHSPADYYSQHYTLSDAQQDLSDFV